MAWIDYKKVFDSEPHSWILASFNMYRADVTATPFAEYSMRDWKTDLMQCHQSGCTKTVKISGKRGIFQGDSLSSLHFCLALIPLSNMLNRLNVGCKIESNQQIT